MIWFSSVKGRQALGDWNLSRAIERACSSACPGFLTVLSAVGTAAMIWVGGGIILHGLESYGLDEANLAIHDGAKRAADVLPLGAGAVEWILNAAGSGSVGLFVGATLIPITGFILHLHGTSSKAF